MAGLVLWVLLLGFVSGSDATWCVCRADMNNAALQKTLDYACGAGADCGPILQNGPCYNPNTVAAHCSYAANSYFQKKGQSGGTCDFSGTAVVTNTDPSYPGCAYPATASAAGTGTTTPTTPPGATPTPAAPGTTPTTPLPGTPTTPTTPLPGTPTTPMTPTTPTTGTPTTFNPGGGSTNGVLGGGGAVGPTGSGPTLSTDGSAAGKRRLGAGSSWVSMAALVLSGVVLLRSWH